MWHWKARLMAFIVGFIVGLILFLLFSFITGLFRSHTLRLNRTGQPSQTDCHSADSFAQPEEILASIKSDDVLVRREMFRRLFFRPGVATIYYDYERDRDYPERAERAALQYINMDDSTEDEAVLTFVRHENPVALILKRNACGWRPAGVLSAWLRFEDYPYSTWLELPETIKPGVHEILVRDSAGDATFYVRNVRILKLINGTLEQIAEFTEETIQPLEGYREPDWPDVKRREVSRYTFLPESTGQAARLRIETLDEAIKYSGAPPAYTYWLETDGAWHASRKQWKARPTARLKLLANHTRELVWNEQQKRFVEEKSGTNR